MTLDQKTFEVLIDRVNALESALKAISGRGIQKTLGVCGGSATIAQTRIPVWTLESFRRQGVSESALLDSYPSLTATDLANAWAYVAANSDEIEQDIHENEVDDE